MRRLIVLAATAALVLAAPITAEAKSSAKPRYQVTAVVNAVTSEVGKTVKVTGKITGKSAAGKFVSVQRKNGTGAWSTVARAKVTKKRTYTARVPMTNGGKTSIRVVMPATRSARTGISSTRTLTVYRWLPAVAQPALIAGEMIRDTTGTIKGTKYPRSIALFNGAVAVKTSKLCTRFATTLGFDDSSTGLTPDSAFQAAFGDPTLGGSPVVDKFVKTGDRIDLLVPITPSAYFATFVNGPSDPSAVPLVGTPRLYCAADALPALRPNEVDLLAS